MVWLKNQKFIFLALLFIFISNYSISQYASISVGVMPFFDFEKSSSRSKRSKIVVSDVTNALSRYKFIKLVERSRMDKLMAEIQLGQTGILDEETSAKIGKMHGIEIMILGTITNKRISARAVEVKTGRIIATGQSRGKSLSKKIDSMGKSLASNLEVYLAKENLKSMSNDSPAIDMEFYLERFAKSRFAKSRRYRISPGKTGKVKIGEKVVFHFRSNESGYLTIVDFQPGGDVVILYPNDFHPDNSIAASKNYTIPSANDTFDIIVSKPAGIDTVVAFFTQKKVKWLDRKKLTGQGFRTVKKEETLGLARGFRIKATKLKNSEWESTSLEIEVLP